VSFPLVLVAVVLGSLVPAPGSTDPTVLTVSTQPTTGRIVVTVTTLEGTVEMSGMQVELRQADDGTVLAKTVSDEAGRVSFPDIPPGRYTVTANRAGFLTATSAAFEVRANEQTQVLLDTQLTFQMPTVEVQGDNPSPNDSVQPVSMSDMLSGSVLESAPLEGDDFQSLLPLLPGVVRGADGRLRIKGGQPSQGALQVSSASLIDPSTGDFDLELPGQAVESVEVLSNPFAAEYGRFSTSITQLRTRRGTNAWEFKPGNLMPRLRKSLTGIRNFEPRFSVRGPLVHDRFFLSQDFQFRYLSTPVRSLEGEPEIRVRSFDSFTRFDSVLSSEHTLGGGIITFPRDIKRSTMNTFRPAQTTPSFGQAGLATGIVDRLGIGPSLVLETTISARTFEVEVDSAEPGPMIYAPDTQSGAYFNNQERNVRSFQWVESLSLSRDIFAQQHVFKVGLDLQRSTFNGYSESRPLEVRRLDGTLAELTTFGNRTEQDVSGTEFSVFAQDRWRVGSRLTIEAGFRLDRDPIVDKVNFSPRGGLALGLVSDGRTILRGGFGNFVQRTPLNVGAFPTYESRLVTRFLPDGSAAGRPVLFRNIIDPDLDAPEANVASVELDQRFGRRVLMKAALLDRRGRQEYVLVPDATLGVLGLGSTGSSRYREFEATARYLGGERRDLTASYVWSRGTADLNNYDQFYGNIRNPIVRENENNRIPTDVPHRLLVRGNFGLAGPLEKWDLAPVIELRSGFPYSAVDEYQDFVGERNRAGRLPTVRTVDFSLTRDWRFKKYRFRAGLRFYNIFNSDANRDVQNNVTSPFYGTSYNPIERSIGITFGSAR
jgi:hypothetical protein